MSEEHRTVQLRRYELDPTQVDDFVAWWGARLAPVRRLYGFAVEFAYLSRDTCEFFWAVSVLGDMDEFVRRESEYVASPERHEAFNGVPERVMKQHIAYVDAIESE